MTRALAVATWVTAFARHHELSPARIAGTSVAMAVHVLALMVLMLPARQAEPSNDVEELVTTVQFIPISGERFRPVPPAPPPPVKADPKPQPPKVKAQTAAIAPPTPPIEEGTQPLETSHLTTMLASADEMSDLDLPQPDSPPTEILSYRNSNPPTYPPESIANGDAGWVTLRVLVDIDGSPLTFVLVKTTAPERLVEAAITAIKQWRFNPAVKGGQPVPAWIEVPIGFYHERAAQPVAVAASR